MTRRKFFQKLAKAGAAIIVGGIWFTKKAMPRKFVRAFAVKKYPGLLKPLQDISKQSKWSG
jgi:hypothetical protein